MKHIELWPPLGQIQSDIESCPLVGKAKSPGVAERRQSPSQLAGAVPANSVLGPMQDWLRRRHMLGPPIAAEQWAPGLLLGVPSGRRLYGVLLDRCVVAGLWAGWMVAPECDWAGAFDVLLEPQDEPFDPACGLIQTWNGVTLGACVCAGAQVLGRLSGVRMAAVRAVYREFQNASVLTVPPELGRIALRVAGGKFTVLTGAPLLAHDPRAAYQAMYRRAGSRLSAVVRLP